ncbi:hypothetical protein GGR50DRAFT_89359 [Xylaria sp. CBS 124048]|nr:hypothetical protein GGR50DRAFT_89359 [Xylaria sp. CBS 124048]
MAADQVRRCRWEGCCSCNVALGDQFCRQHRPFAPGLSPSTKERKLLSDRHTARKTAQPPPNAVQFPANTSKSPIAKSSIDSPSADSRPAKRQRLSGSSNGLELPPRSSSSLFAENGIPQSSKRGMFRQSEEAAYKLSAIDDFALRPKKKGAANESAFNEQQQLYHKSCHNSSQLSRTTPEISQRPLNVHVYNGSPAVGFTEKHGPPLYNGIAVGQQKDQKPPEERSDSSCEQNKPVNWAVEIREQMPVFQSANASQARQGRPVEPDSKDFQLTEEPEQAILGTPAIIDQKPPKMITITFKPGSKKKRPKISIVNTKPRPVHADTAIPKHQPDMPPAKARQRSDGPREFFVDDKHPTPISSDVDVLETVESPTENSTKSTVEATATPDLRITPQAPASSITLRSQSKGLQAAAKTVEPIAISATQPLSALLGGRKWKDMSPEERRQFWVSQHDPQKLDDQIYSEYNRPFRPGDSLFGIASLPPQSARLATHFGYINPRTYCPSLHQQSEEWYQQKQDEIAARGNRKANFGRVVQRAAERKRAAPKLTREQERARLPKRVRDNKKWLAALEVLEQLEAQKREFDLQARETSVATSSPEFCAGMETDGDSSWRSTD